MLVALRIAPIGTGRTDVYLFPGLAFLIAVSVSEIASMVAPRAGGPPPWWVVSRLLRSWWWRSPRHSQRRTRPRISAPWCTSRRRLDGPGTRSWSTPTAGFAYGIATRFPIDKRADALSPTDWVVKVGDPNVVVLEAHRDDPEKWSGPLDQITAGSPRVWLIGSHLFPDWPVLQQMLAQRGYVPVRMFTRPGAELNLFVRSPKAPVTPSP